MSQANRAASLYSLLSCTERTGIRLSIENGSLKLSGKVEVLSVSLLERLHENKEALVAALAEPAFDRAIIGASVSIPSYLQKSWSALAAGGFDVSYSNAMHWVARLRMPLDTGPAMQACIDALVAEYPILGSAVARTQSGVELRSGVRVALAFEDLSELAHDSRESLAKENVDKRIWRPFEPHEPLFRVFVLKLAAADFVLGFVLNRLIGDHRSVELLVGGLFAVYKQMAIGSIGAFAGTPVRYPEYLAGYAAWLSGAAAQLHLEFWNEQFRDLEANAPLVDRTIDPDQQATIASSSFRIEARSTDGLLDLAARFDCSLSTILIAATVVTLRSIFSASRDIAILAAEEEIDDPRLSAMIGNTQSGTALCVRTPRCNTFRDLTAEIQQARLVARRHKLPAEYARAVFAGICASGRIVEIHVCNIDAAFAALGLDTYADFESFEITPPPRAAGTPRHWGAPRILFERTQYGLEARVEYLQEQYHSETISRLTAALRSMLRQAPVLALRSIGELSTAAIEQQRESTIIEGACAGLPPVSVKGNRFVDARGKTMLFRGVSIADCHDLDRRGQWRASLFQAIRRMGADLIRLPVHPSAWRERGEQGYLALLDEAVKWCSELQLYVMIDWHSIGNLRTGMFHGPEYATSVDETLRFWRTVAAHFRNETIVAFYELFNEPTHCRGKFGSLSWREWCGINEEMIGIVRSVDQKSIPLVAGFDWAYDLSSLRYEPVNRQGIGYTSHPYPFKRSSPWEHKWEESFAFAAARFPLIVTECGFETGEDDVIDDEHYGPRLIRFLEGRGISWIAWCFDPEWRPAMLNAFEQYELSRSGRFFEGAMRAPPAQYAYLPTVGHNTTVVDIAT